jgi:hypothetical protein
MEKKNCVRTTMIENLNVKLKNIYNDKHFKKKMCSINRDFENTMLSHKRGKMCIYMQH